MKSSCNQGQYNVVGVETKLGKNRLMVHMVCRANLRDTPITPMPLLGSEMDLNGGRFHAYDRNMFNHSVFVGVIGYRDISQGFVNLVEWVAEHAVGTWNFHLAYDEVKMACHTTFYFDDLGDAVLFRLSIN